MSYIDERGRVSTRVAGIIQRGLAREAVAVRNVSVGGAMIELTAPPSEGETLLFECNATGLVDARVAWVVGNRCGLRFKHLIPSLARTATG